jgi:hypothetical protein
MYEDSVPLGTLVTCLRVFHLSSLINDYTLSRHGDSKILMLS